MKKILVSLMLLVMTALSAHAQFEKEVWYVNASLTGLDLSHSKNEGTNFGFALTGGAFVADNVAVLLNFKGNYIDMEWMKPVLVHKDVIIFPVAVFMEDWEWRISTFLV